MIQPSQPHPHPNARRHRPGLLRFSAAQFLIALVITLFAYPFIEEFKYGEIYEALLLTLTLSTAVLAVGRRRRTLVIATLLMLPALIGKWLNHFLPNTLPATFFLAASILCIGFVVFQLFHYILQATDVDSEVLCAAVATYLMIGLLWAFAYKFLDTVAPLSFVYTSGPPSAHTMNGFTGIYFSLCTLSTVGFGDIVPVSNIGRMLAAAESITGVFYGTILIARLVALYSTKRPPTPAH
ncbi:MAG: potassium channel family protein [Verrucomicrobiota bacterium]